ncbi:MAG: AAA family ATPase [Blastocatellia bacterium]
MASTGINPFTVQQAVKGLRLADRREELHRVKTALQQGRKLFLIGPRRFGKTSILLTVEEELRKKKCFVVMLNVQSFTSIEALTAGIVGSAARFSGSLKRATTFTREIFSRLNPNLSWNPAEGTFEVSLGIKTTDPSEQGPLLVEALNSLERLAGDSGQNVGVIFDEFQELLILGGAGVEKQLRAAIQTHERVGYVFAGSETSLLTDMISNSARPFYRLGEPLFLKAIPQADFSEYIRAGFGQFNCQIADAALELLYAVAEEVPYNVQLLAETCWEEAARQGRKQITPEEIRGGLRRLLGRFDPVYAGQWAALIPNHRKVLAAIARGTDRRLFAKQVLRQTGLTSGNISKSLQSLEKSAILRKEYQGEETIWRFEDPLFKQWILASTRG